MKTCTQCKQTLPLDSFHNLKTSSDGKRPRCKACRSEVYRQNAYSYNPDELYTCRRCKETKPKRYFYRKRDATSGCKSYCKRCAAIMYKFNFESLLKKLWMEARERARKRKMEFSLEPDFLHQLWDRQEGRCSLSDRGMTWSVPSGITGDSENISLDRIDSSKGYVPENVHLVTARVNLMKKDFVMSVFVEVCRDIANHVPPRSVKRRVSI